MKSYTVKNTDDITRADTGAVMCWPWKGFEFQNECKFKISHTNDRFIVSLRTYEENPVARVTEKNGPVCNDSCMEFFFSPSADNSMGYFNFEVNSNPTYLFEYGLCGSDFHPSVDCSDEELNVRSTKSKTEGGCDFWQVDFELPYELIKRCAPECDLSSGAVIRANVYKCGRTDQKEHYGSWNPVETERPNFHMPEFFGKFIIE